MLLTLVVCYLTYIQVSYTLPPLAYQNNDNQFRYNERFLHGANLVQQNTYGLTNYSPVYKNAGIGPNYNAVGSSVAITSPGNIEIINNVHKNPSTERSISQSPTVRQELNNIRTLTQNYENVFNERTQENVLPQLQRANLAQNFQINLRGYVAPDLNNGLIPPQPTLPKLLPSQIGPVQKSIQAIGVHNTQNKVNIPSKSAATPLQRQTKLDIASGHQKKTYTIVHPNGTIEETDDFEYIKKNYPYYIIHDLRETKKNNAETDVRAGSPLQRTIVPIHNVPPAQPLSNIKETLVPNTLYIAQTHSNPTKIEESINTSDFKTERTLPKHIVLRNMTDNNSIESGIPKIYKNEKAVESTEKNDLPIRNEKVISASDVIKAPENGEDVDEMFEKISAADFWRQIDVIAISDEAAPTDKSPLEETKDNQSIKNATTQHDVPPQSGSQMSDDQPILTDDTYEVFNADPDFVEDFVQSIEDRIEFIKPFLILNDTNDNSNSTEQVDSDLSEAGQGITTPIYVPHISKVDAKDTNSSFWFTTNDEKAWQKLAPQNKKNVTTVSNCENHPDN